MSCEKHVLQTLSYDLHLWCHCAAVCVCVCAEGGCIPVVCYMSVFRNEEISSS